MNALEHEPQVHPALEFVAHVEGVSGAWASGSDQATGGYEIGTVSGRRTSKAKTLPVAND